MARRLLPRALSDAAGPTRVRDAVRAAADNATDVFHPLLVISRGLRLLAVAALRRWKATPKERRGPAAFAGAACLMVVALVPYGPLLALVCVMAAAAWAGRERTPGPAGPDGARAERLQALYEALVPYFSAEHDPRPLYAHGGDWQQPFTSYEFDEGDRLTRLSLKYPAYFTDGEPEARDRVEQVLHAKSGRGREYHFAWDEEDNRLVLTVLGALPADIVIQRFVTAPGETVLGFTDPDSVPRTLPVTCGDRTRDEPPVVWRTGHRSTEPHLLALGRPGAGTTTLLRSIALQGLLHGDVLVIDGTGTGEFACLAGRTGVMGVEHGLLGATATLEWAAHETERRLITTNRARQIGRPAPEDTRRPLWIIVDRPSGLAHLAAAEGRADPQSLLDIPLRHGRAAQVTVVVAEHLEHAGGLSEAVRTHTRARVVLGPVTAREAGAVLGAPPHTTPPAHLPPGRGYARLGGGPVHRLQVPATPDPFDEATGEAQRQAVEALLPGRVGPIEDAPAGRAAEPVDAGEPVDGPEPVDTTKVVDTASAEG
ncbi:hypothetical protein [Streptomyces sp. NPDC003077]|uniref:hypothetical protein n=1 Tax=Streptomyces sp. NPDC003077 TaxID=3154443 RepID=UPI0033B83E78